MYSLIKELALPPANLLVLVIAGYLLRRRRSGKILIATGFVALCLLSNAFVSSHLLKALEAGIAAPGPQAAPPQAIVVLSAGYLALQPAGDAVTVDSMTLERLRFAARRHRETGLPLLVTGGSGRHENRPPVGRLMADSLQRDFGMAAAWVEDRSATTMENATFSAEILAPLGIRSVYVVTQAWHLPRAIAAFRAAGFTVWPVAAGYTNTDSMELDPAIFIPSAKALRNSYYAIHELLGRVWYRAFGFG
ncbi:MAG: YdcF family protein [Proteobacteria bacterium]|nr:YdcF family protein [Pseudomonadota bacterium]